MSFSQLLEESFDIDQRVISPNTKRSYESCLRVYEEAMTNSLKNAPTPFPITPDKARGFIIHYLKTHPNTTFDYLR